MAAPEATSPCSKPAPTGARSPAVNARAMRRPTVRDKASPAHPDCRVTARGIAIGAGWVNHNRTTGEPYTRLDIAHPDIGPRAYKVNLGRAADQDDDTVFAMLWNLRGLNAAPHPRRPARGLARPAPPPRPKHEKRPPRDARGP